MTIARLRDVAKQYGGRDVVADLSFEVRAGEVFGFLGPNGAGKTTTLRMLVGLARATSGSIELFGQPVPEQYGSVATRVGAVVSAPAFYRGQTALDNLQILAQASGVHRDASFLEGLLEVVGLSRHRDDRFRGFSSGMQRRLSVAAALITEPDLLILDEPTAGLDPDGVRDFRQLVRNFMAAKPDRAVVLSSHQLSDIEMLCDRVALIRNGRLAKYGDLTELMAGSNPSVALTVSNHRLARTCLTRANIVAGGSGEQVIVPEADLERSLKVLARRNVFPADVKAQRITLEEVFFAE